MAETPSATDGRVARLPTECRRSTIYGPATAFISSGDAKSLSSEVAGGDKRTQNHDIAMAIKLARDL